MTLENPQFSIGNTSSNDGFSIVMLVFGDVYFFFKGFFFKDESQLDLKKVADKVS